jgi:hypothetical protein
MLTVNVKFPRIYPFHRWYCLINIIDGNYRVVPDSIQGRRGVIGVRSISSYTGSSAPGPVDLSHTSSPRRSSCLWLLSPRLCLSSHQIMMPKYPVMNLSATYRKYSPNISFNTLGLNRLITAAPTWAPTTVPAPRRRPAPRAT